MRPALTPAVQDLLDDLQAWISQPHHWVVLAGSRATIKTSVLFALADRALQRAHPAVFWEFVGGGAYPATLRDYTPAQPPETWWLLDEWLPYRAPTLGLSSGIVAITPPVLTRESLMRLPAMGWPFGPEATVAWMTCERVTPDTVRWTCDTPRVCRAASGVVPRGFWPIPLPAALHHAPTRPDRSPSCPFPLSVYILPGAPGRGRPHRRVAA